MFFNSDAAAATLLARNPTEDFIRLTDRFRTGDQLNQVQRDQFAANAALAQTALGQAGQMAYLDKRLDYEREQAALDRRQNRRNALLQGLAGLGSSFAGGRMGLDPGSLPSVDVNSLLAKANERQYQLSTLFDPSPDFATYLAQVAQGARGLGQQ